MTSIRRPGNTGITGGMKGVKNNKVPTSPKKAETTKKHEGGWKPNHKPAQPPARPPPAR